LGIFVIGVGAGLVAGTWLMWLLPALLFLLDHLVIFAFGGERMALVVGDADKSHRCPPKLRLRGCGVSYHSSNGSVFPCAAHGATPAAAGAVGADACAPRRRSGARMR